MPKIQIRPAIEEDIPRLMALEHDYSTENVWQMDIQYDDTGQTIVRFRPVRLPREARVEYPRSRRTLPDDWASRSGLLVAELSDSGGVIGYTSLSLNMTPNTTWMTDLVIANRYRRQGVGTAMIFASLEWARQHGSSRLLMEMQPKNHPAISLVKKIGFEFCGYNDRYYMNRDIALFFAKPAR